MKVRAKSIVHDHIVDEFNHPGLSPGRIYWVVGVSEIDFRVIDDNDEPLLYPKALFEMVDSTIPSDWITERYENAEYCIDPPECAERGFYEDYFDGVESAIKIFEAFKSRYTAT